MKLFEDFKIKNMVLKNRIVMPPMCMYQADRNGFPNFFHYCHYGVRAQGGAGLIIVEATGVTPEGRISDNDLGIWSDAHIAGLEEITEHCHKNGAKTALQLNHSGRKSVVAALQPIAPSAIAAKEGARVPQEMSLVQINAVVAAFRSAARRADAAGFDALELHGAHGYLIHQFLSPISNRRTDGYGGVLENRIRFLKEVLMAVREIWPREKPLWLRVSASDYIQGGVDADMMSEIIRSIKPLIDLVHVSSGGILPVTAPFAPGYQVPFAEKIKKECGLPVIAVGLITEASMAEEILEEDRADLVAFGRLILRDPYWTVRTAIEHGVEGYVPKPYEKAFNG